MKFWIFQQAVDTLNRSGIHIPGGDVRSTFNNLKGIFSGPKGLRSYRHQLKSMNYFSFIKEDLSVEDLLNRIDGKFLFTNDIGTIEAIVERLFKSGQIDQVTTVLSIFFCFRLSFFVLIGSEEERKPLNLCLLIYIIFALGMLNFNTIYHTLM